MNSRIFYRGPSQLDGAPILGVITGLETPSTNTKTGDMLQTYILREDVSPPDAVLQGLDRSICGDCALRGNGTGLGRSCYVQVKWAPLAVWKVVQPQLVDDPVRPIPLHFTRDGLKDRFLRMGTYGDPTAIPLDIWRWLLKPVAAWTGYTHQWRDPLFGEFRSLCMASVDTVAEQHIARAFGWRTFRTRQSEADPHEPNEITCPASAEAGHKTTCAACRLCDGRRQSADRRTSIVIVAHGSRTHKYNTQVLPFD